MGVFFFAVTRFSDVDFFLEAVCVTFATDFFAVPVVAKARRDVVKKERV